MPMGYVVFYDRVCVCDLACERLVETLWRPHLITAVACMMLAMQMHAGY
jgi:hypothetical protein